MFTVSPATAQSGWERPGADGERIGLVTAGQGDEVQFVVDELSNYQQETGGVLVRHQPVTRMDPAEVRRLVAVRDEGREAYFFASARRATAVLERRLEGTLDVSARWIGHTEAGAALFDAGMLLVRAKLDQGETESATRWMDRLVAAMPAHSPDQQRVPPETVELWEERRERFREGTDARLDVRSLQERPQCRPTLNGARIEEPVVDVVAGRTYLLGEECNGGEPRHWWVRAGESQRWVVFAPDESTTSTDIGEVFERLGGHHDLDAVVYVGPADCGDDAMCLAVDAGEGPVQFGDYDSNVEQFLEVVTGR